jgi:radical SAM superfamily enzyme YgiQ (UPF0313 family)
MKDLLLIQPIVSLNNSSPVLPQDSVGIGMLTILAYIKKFGFSGEVIHIPRALEEGHSWELILQKIKEENPKVIGIGLNWLHFSEGALEIAKILRNMLPNTTIVIGGQHATLFANEILQCNNDIDGITIGESEITYYYLLKILRRGIRSIPSGIPGIMLNNLDKGLISIKPDVVENLDELPLYTYSDVWPHTQETCAALDTVRGECMRNCAYCIESKTNYLQGRSRFVEHSSEYLANQVKAFVDEGIHSVTIQDPFFLTGDNKIKQFCKCLKDKGIKLKLLNIFVEPRIIAYDTLHSLKEVAEDVSLDYGMETGANETAKLIGRSYPKADILENMKYASEIGIKVLTWWMTALPGDNKESLRESLNYIEETIKCGVIPRWVTPLILFPQTDMAKDNEHFGIKTNISTFNQFRNYSKVKANNYGVYYDLLTHETTNQTKREIVESTIALKKAIADKMSENRHILLEYGWNETELKAFENEVRGSFY